MADEELGSLGVSITGDYSDLQDAINEAVGAATKGAEQITDAFSSVNGTSVENLVSTLDELAKQSQTTQDAFQQAVSVFNDAQSAFNEGTASAQTLDLAMQQLQGAADAAGVSLGQAGAEVSKVRPETEDAAAGLKEMAEQLTAVAEGLAITEGLKEFGEEALKAFGTVQSVTVGLEQLTKSAESADQIVEQIKQLASTEPFAFPEIAPTVQKMVALGVSAQQIPGAMQAIADASSAVGNSFQQVANSFDRMALSGTANARSLTQLGISTKDLGDAMGVSASAAAAMFKSLDESQRIDVLEQALTKFTGAAAAQAQTLSGQWQIFQNKFEEVMVGVGASLAPAISGILSFGSVILDEVGKAIGVFNELPSPVKNVAVALGLVAAAAVPVLTAVSGLGFGIIGLNAAATAATSVLAALGISTGEAAVAQGALTIATEAATVAEGEDAIATLADARAKQTLATASAEAAGAGGVGALSGALSFLGGVVLPATIGAIAGFGIATAKDLYLPTTNVESFNEEMGAFTQDVAGGTSEVTAFGDAFPPAIANMKLLGAAAGGASGNIKDVTDKLGLFLNPLADVNAKQAAANETFAKANLAYSEAGLQLAAVAQKYGTASAQYQQATLSMARASVELQTAQQNLVAHGKDWADTIGGITQKMGEAQTKFSSLTTLFSQLSQAAANGAQNNALLATVYTKLETAAKDSGNAFASYQGILAQTDVSTKQNYANTQALGTAYGALLTLQSQGVDVTAQLATVYGTWAAAGLKTGVAISTAAGEMAKFKLTASQQTDELNSLAGAFVKLSSVVKPTENDQLALDGVFKKMMSDADAMGISITTAGNSLVFAAKAGTTASPALQAFIDTQNKQFASTNNLINVNGKLATTIAALFGGYNQATAAAKANADAVAAAGKAASDHANSMAGEIQALQQQANSLNVSARAAQDAASASANVTLMTKNFQIAANSQIQTLQNAVDAFNNLNSTTATTAQDQIALQDAFNKVQSMAQAAGIQVKFVGDQLVFAASAATSADPKFQQLAADMNKVAQAAQGAANQVKDAAKQVTSMEDDIKSFDSILGRAPSAGGSVSGIAGTTVNGPGGVSVTIPIPTDPDPGNDYWSPQAQAWLSIPKGYVPLPGTHTDAPVGTANNPTPTAGGSTSSSGSSSSSGFVAFGLAVGAATTAVSGVTTAATAVATPLGDFASIIPGATTATRQFTTGLLSTTHTAKDYETATEIASGATNSYAQAVSDAANASAAYSNAVSQGTDSGTIAGLYTAMQEAQVAVDDMRGQTRLVTDASQALASTTGTYSDDLAAAMNAVKGQTTTYDQAVQSLTSATNAYGQALATGTATQDQLNSLKAAQVVAAQQVNDQTGVSRGPSLSNPQITVSGTPTPVQIVSVAGRTPGITNFTVDNPAYTTPSNPDYGSPFTSSNDKGITLTVNVNAGTVVGTNAANQLTDIVAPMIVAKLRQAGVKL